VEEKAHWYAYEYSRMPLRVQIVTAEREVFAEDAVDMVVAPGAEGVVGILPRHAPLLTTLVPGVVRVKKGGSEEAMAVGGGFLQVARDQVLILADTAERADEVDEARAEEGRRQAQRALTEAAASGQRVQAEAARVMLRREEARVHVARRRGRRQPGPGHTEP
jgi:F-type H+-transporting ATPase subunit epsilon